jgi:penicillin-binding protein 2
MREENKKLKLLSRRAFALGLLKGIALTGLAARYYYLQVIEEKRYALLSDKNRIHIDLIPPIRGNIFSADGKIIAGNRSTYQLSVQISKFEHLSKIVKKLGNIMNNENYIDNSAIARAKANFLPNHNLILKTDLTWQEISKLSSFSYLIPEAIITNSSMRYYPYADVTTHISGYVASLSAKEQENFQDMRSFDAKIGKNGIEKQYQKILQGKPGINKVEVNVLGSKIRNIETQSSIKGDDVYLAINIDLQNFIYEALGDNKGSIVVLDIENSKVLAMLSAPSYNANLFVNGISNEDWKLLINNPDSPLINKAISFAYPPGSTMKPISALALLSAGIDPLHKVFCNGEYTVGNRVFHCWKRGGHGEVNLSKSISASCNVYYYHMANRITIKQLHETASKLGLGKCTNIELPFETCGLMPDKQWKLKRFRSPWTIGDTVNSIIGQGYTSATPLQLATMAARIGSGKLITPSMLNHNSSHDIPDLNINNSWLKIVRNGMYNSLNSPEGTGFRYRLPYHDFAVAGKTGTAQVASIADSNKIDDHGLFIGFAPYHKPKFAIATIIEHGKWGSQSAAPLSLRIMDFIRNNLHKY